MKRLFTCIVCPNGCEIEAEYEKAVAYYGIAQEINALRKPIDSLEELVDNKLWPLPKYRELLFIS